MGSPEGPTVEKYEEVTAPEQNRYEDKEKTQEKGENQKIDKPKTKKPLKLQKVEQVPFKLNEAQFAKEIEQPQFSKMKLKKPDIKPKKEQASTVLPKIQLKSRIKFITDWPPKDFKPIITFLKSVRQNGELSRNIKEAAKLKKKKVKMPEIPDLPSADLEKPDLVSYDKEEAKPAPEKIPTDTLPLNELVDENRVEQKLKDIKPQPEISPAEPVVKKKTKLKPMTIEEKVIEPNMPQFAESMEEPQFKKIQLKKAVVKTKPESSTVKVPKIQLKSRIKFVDDWPPVIIKPNISFLGGVRQNGILSRNIKEAAKIKKTVLKQPVLPELEKTQLEKPMFTQEDILETKSKIPENVEEEFPNLNDDIEDEPEQFTITHRRPSLKKIEEIVDEVTIKKKLKPVRKSSITLPEITEPEEVTFRPKITKTKEEVEQEFNIHLDSYEEEEISMSSKVKLKPQRQPTFNEEGNEVSIRVYEEKESEGDNIIEIIESDDEKEESTNIIMPIKKIIKPAVDVSEEITSSVTVSKPKSSLIEPKFTEDVTFDLDKKPKYVIDDQEITFEVKKQKDEFKSEELTLSSKIKLAPKKKITIDEAGDETSIRLEQEVEQDGQVEEVVISEGESEERVEMVLKRKPKKPTYEVSEVEELSVEFKPKKIGIDTFEEEQLTISTKRVPRKPSQIQEAEASMNLAREQEFPVSPADVRSGDTVFAVYSYVAESDEAISLVEGERLYILDTTNQDWWFVRKHLTEEKGWVPAQYLMDETNYTLYLQKKLNEKIDKLPVFEKPTSEERAIAPIFVEKLRPKHTPDGSTVQFECQVEGYPRPQITWFRQTAIIKPSQDFQMYYDDDNVATLVIREVFPEDAGTFTCVAKNAAGFASSTAELTVDAPLSDHGSELAPLSRKSLSRESSLADILEGIPPTFSKRPKAQYVDEGSQIFLECRLVAIPEPDIAWFFKGEEVVPDDNVSVAIESDMHMYCSVLKISNVKKFQEGTYTVLAVNREGEASLPIVLKIKTGEKERPQVIEPLKSMTIREGESVVLTTQVVGTPEPKVVWYKNNKPIKEPIKKTDGNVHSITLLKPKKGKDDGVYSLKATNSEGSAETSAVITIDEPTEEDAEPPLFINRFQELTVKEKGVIRLNAKVTGNPVPSITWYRNNQIITPSETVTQSFDGENIELVITNVDSEIDSGDYKCVASNSAGKASHGARVTIDVDKVTFVRHLNKRYETEEGKTVVLECETSHTVSTKWYHDGKELSGMDHREIIQESRIHKLRIKKCKLSDKGTIKCIVKDQETSATLIVNETIPEFVRKLQDFEVKERDIAILEVEVNSETADVTWEKEGRIIKPKKNKYEIEKRGNVRKLFIRNTSVHDEGEYTCKLRDDACTAEVTVVELPPEIITRLRDQRVSRGNRATFDIELTKGDALVRWFKDGSEIQFSNRIQLTIDGKKQKLKIYDCEESDEGVYACEVGNDRCTARLTVEEPSIDFTLRLPEVIVVPVNTDAYLTVEVPEEDNEVTWFRRKTAIIEDAEKFNFISDGKRRVFVIRKCTEEDQCEYSCQLEETRCTTRLKVEVAGTAPIITDYEKIYRVRRGADVTITVRYTGRTAHEQWRRDGEPLPRSKRRKPTSETGSASLTLRKTERADAGVYTLRLENEFGEAQVDMEVIIMDVPSQPGKPSILEVVESSVHVCWSEPQDEGHSPVQCYILEYQEIDTAEWTSIENIKSTQHRVTNLRTGSSYRFRAFAVNEVGVGESSEITEFVRIETTIKEGPPTVEKPLRDTVASPGESIELTCIFGGVPVPTVTWTVNGSPLPRTKTTFRDRMAALPLTVDTTVEGEYRCVATNKYGRIETSCTVRIQQKPTVTIVDEELVKRVYRVDEPWSVTARIAGVPRPDVRWRKDGVDIDVQRVEVNIDEETTVVIIRNLRRSDGGKYSVEAVNEAGSASAEIPLAVYDVPSAPQGPLGFFGGTTTAVTLAWHVPASDGGCSILDYSVEASVAGKWHLLATTQTTELRTDKLETRVKYRFRICARNEIGISMPYLSEEDFVLGDGPTRPTAPQRLHTRSVTSRTVTLQWEPPEFDGGSPLTNYIVECREVEAGEAWRKVVTVQATTLQHRVENIRARRLLEFRVSAENAVGVGLPATCEPVRLVTHATVPSPPTGPLELRALGGAVAAVSWGVPEWDGGSPLLRYTVAVRDVRKTMWMQVGEVDAATLRFHIRDLTEDRAYAIRIYAVNEVGASEPLESHEPFEVVPGEDSVRSEGPGEATEATEPTSFSTQTSTSWLRDHNMDADIRSYARGSLLRRDEYFFRIWHYARRLFE